MKKAKWFIGSMICSLMATAMIATAQDEIQPRSSPYAEVMQRVHTTDVKITYHRPAVKEREIWGELVPYDSEKPWRAGANDATQFQITGDVKINGKTLEKGNYTFYAFVSEDKWTLVFNSVEETWGSYDYDPEKDALRVEVEPVETDHTEWLTFGFADFGEKSAKCYLKWEKVKIPFEITVD